MASERRAVFTAGAPEAIGPYSQAIAAGGLLYCSGQVGLVPGTKEMVQGGVAEETRQVLANLSAVLTAGGASLDNVIRATIYLTDLGDFSEVNRVYGEHFSDPPPARATVQVVALPAGAQVEIDAIALIS